MDVPTVVKGVGIGQLEKFKHPGIHKVTSVKTTLNYPDDMFPREDRVQQEATRNAGFVEVIPFFANKQTLDLTNKTMEEELFNKQEMEKAAKTLKLPEDLRVEKKIPNPLYDIYYVPGYDQYKLGNNPDFKIEDKKKSNRLRTLAEKNINNSTMPSLNSSKIFVYNLKANKPDLNTAIGPNIGLQINTSGYHPAKREANYNFGKIDVNNDQAKMKHGTEYWQSTAQHSYEDWKHPELSKGNKPE